MYIFPLKLYIRIKNILYILITEMHSGNLHIAKIEKQMWKIMED